MSMSGMISMRARFFGIGEATCILVRGPGHGKSDRDPNLRDCARSKTPAPEGTDSRVIEDWTPNALRHRGIGDISARYINGDDADTAAGDVP